MGPDRIVDSGGQTVILCYGLCRCNVWPLSYAMPYGRCGRCREKPELLDPYLINTKQEALDIFYERYGHYPEPFGEQ